MWSNRDMALLLLTNITVTNGIKNSWFMISLFSTEHFLNNISSLDYFAIISSQKWHNMHYVINQFIYSRPYFVICHQNFLDHHCICLYSLFSFCFVFVCVVVCVCVCVGCVGVCVCVFSCVFFVLFCFLNIFVLSWKSLPLACIDGCMERVKWINEIEGKSLVT